MARKPIEPAAPRGLAIPIWTWPVDALAAWIRGAVVIDDGSGELVEGGANPTLIAGIATSKHPPTNSHSTDTGKFIPALPGIQFEGSVDNNGALGTGAAAATNLGEVFGLTEDASGVWYVDLGKAGGANGRVRITKLIDPAGTVNGRVRFVFLPIVDLGGTPASPTLWGGGS